MNYYSGQQNHYANPASQSYDPSRFQPYNHHQSYSNPYHQHQQQYQQPQQHQYHSNTYHQPQQQQQQQYYSNTYPQQHHPRAHYQEPPIHPPSQPFSASYGQAHVHRYHHFPQRADGVAPGHNPAAAAVAVAALAQVTGGSHGQSWSHGAEGIRPVIGGPGTGAFPRLGSGLFPGHGPGPTGSLWHVGQSLDKGGGQLRGSEPSFRGKGHNHKGDATPVKAKKLSKPRLQCELCKVYCGKLNDLERHKRGKRHIRKLNNLEPKNANRTVQNEQIPSGDLKQETTVKPDNLLVVEDTKQNLPKNILLDTVPTEEKINDAQQADTPKDANRELLAKKPMMNRTENQKRGAKRKRPVRQKGKKKIVIVIDEEEQQIEPPKPKVLMCYLCDVKCDTREILSKHLLSGKHISELKLSKNHPAIYDRLGLQALYPPANPPVTQTLYSSPGDQQALNGAQVSDPVAGPSIVPETDSAAAPSATVIILD